MVLNKCESRNMQPCLRVRRKRLSVKPSVVTYRYEHTSCTNLSDPAVVLKQLRHMEYLGNPESLRMNYLYHLRRLVATEAPVADIVALNEEVKL